MDAKSISGHVIYRDTKITLFPLLSLYTEGMGEVDEEFGQAQDDLYGGAEAWRRVGLLVFTAASAALFVGALLAALLD